MLLVWLLISPLYFAIRVAAITADARERAARELVAETAARTAALDRRG